MTEKKTNYQVVDLKNGSFLVKKYKGKNEKKHPIVEKLGTIEQISRNLIISPSKENLSERKRKYERNTPTPLAILEKSLESLKDDYMFCYQENWYTEDTIDSIDSLSNIAKEAIAEKLVILNKELENQKKQVLIKTIVTLKDVLWNLSFTKDELNEINKNLKEILKNDEK